MTLEEKCRELRKWMADETEHWKKRYAETKEDGSDMLATDHHARICMLAAMSRKMQQLGIPE